jgi:NAD(P)-dependent dehydrogenase (short-subunit alcohol dehydrogenase family)
MRDIEIDLAGKNFRIVGAMGAAAAAISAALVANGAKLSPSGHVDLLIAAHALLPDDAPVAVRIVSELPYVNEGGRVIFLLSALAGLPARRHVDYSAAMAAALAQTRGLAMHHAPKILVNAVGAGVIEEDGKLLAGDRSMTGHAALGRPGRLADVVNAVLFLADPANTYTTGQILNVDGGWSAGYGRNF